MLKYRHLLQPCMRRGPTSLLFQSSQVRHRHQIHVVDRTVMPSRLEGFVFINKFPYSVEVEPIIFSRIPDFPVACATLFIRTPDDQELDSAVIEEFKKNINYKFEAMFETDNTHFVQVYCNERKKHTSILPPNAEVGVHLAVPVKFGVRIRGAKDASVHVKDLEGENYEIIMTENANCYLTNLKGSSMSVETEGGSIVCDSSLISTFGSLVTQGDGAILVSKLQGAKFYLETEDGKIDVKALYLKRSEFCSQRGDIQLGDIHGITEVEAGAGNISIGSVTGDLRASTREGDIDICLAQHKSVDVRSQQGNVELCISETPQPSQVNIKSKHLHIAENVDMQVDLEQKGENFNVLSARTFPSADTNDKRLLNVQAKLGEVKIKVGSWLDSLKLRRS